MLASADQLAESLKTAVEAWDALGWARPRVALISGSGLGVDLGEAERGPIDLSYFLPFAAHPLAGHPHQVELLRPLPERRVVYCRGRLHAYQGYDAQQTVFPVRLAAQLGARVLILTNASGALRVERRPGELLLIRDHLNLTGENPLRGQLPPEWGPRFPDLSGAYDPRLAALARRLAGELRLALGDAVYAGVLGPSYETPAEVRMLRALGGDLVGMSTVLEVIAARQMGVACLALSLVANPAAGVDAGTAAGVAADAPGGAPGVGALTHDDVLAAAAAGAADLRRLLGALLASPDLLDD
ncbi:MAG TPA: purine-nucleoside phosphorylase [Thermoanaerobaculia bacterium]|nr:purine-nucleoside phosphorylase [Thermoanaerobaculia bacterium]